MMNFLKRKKNTGAKTDTTTPTPPVESPEPAQQPEQGGFFQRLRAGLSRTRTQLSDGIADLFRGKKQIDDALLEELETILLTADVGAAATQLIIDNLTARVSRQQIADSEALYEALQAELVSLLTPCEQPLAIALDQHPFVILTIGVNGAGKTTTLGKLAKHFRDQDKSVMLAAGDTFRAAAIEQLTAWGERNNVTIVAQQTGADSASVVYDALASAKAKSFDVLLADTAGRLHTQDHLMAELAKIKRVLTKLEPSAPHETLLVLDATIGQNALSQAKQFHEAIGVTGLVITKLDGTAKGGVIFGIANSLGLPIRYIGVGEGIDDLRPFNATDFVQALFTHD